MVDIRNIIFAFLAFLFITVAIIIMALNFEEQFDAGGGILSVGIVFLLAFLCNCLGITNSDEKAVFDDNELEVKGGGKV